MFSSLKIDIIVGVLVLAILGYAGYRVNHAFNEAAKVPGLEADIKQLKADKEALKTQITDNDKQCETDKKLTEDATRDYQNKINSITKQLADLKRLRGNRTIIAAGSNAVAPGNAPGKPNGTAPGNGSAINYGLETDWLYDFAGTCKKEREQVRGLQKFILDLYKGLANRECRIITK